MTLPYQKAVVALSACEADRSLIAYARMLSQLGIIGDCKFVHVRTPVRVAEERKSDNQVLNECQALISELFSATAEEAERSCQVITSPVRIDALIEFIAQQSCDVAILGHRKNRTGRRALARRMAMIAPCSVWLVPEGAPISLSKMMVPTDFSNHAADSLSMAVSIAVAAKLRQCQSIHVYFDPSIIRYDESVNEIRNSEEKAFREFVRHVDSRGVRINPLFVEGHSVAGTILYTAGQQGNDLLVLNTRGRSRSAAILLGSVTSQVMTESPIPVLAVKHFGSMMNLFEALKKSALWSKPNPHTN